MLKLTVNDIEVEVEEGSTVLHAVRKLALKFRAFAIMIACQLLVIAVCALSMWNVHR